MIYAADLVPFLVLGALGSLHCVGMCGGFVLALGSSSGTGRARHALRVNAVHHLGRATTYAVLGALLAAGVERVASLGGWLRWSPVAAGLLLVLMGLLQLGVRLPLPGRGWTRSSFAAAMAPLLGSVAGVPGWTGRFATGLAHGLLPCGLSWSALVLASQTTPLTAFVGMFVFGVATSPALFGVVFGARWISDRWRRHAPRVLGTSLVLFGALTLARAWHADPVTGQPPCCEDGAHAEPGAHSTNLK